MWKVFEKGDKVTFQLYESKTTHDLFATRVKLHSLGGIRYTGIVDRIPNPKPFGFIRYIYPDRGSDDIHFPFSRVIGDTEPEVGDEVEFSVIKDNQDRKGATRILILPKGTIQQIRTTYCIEGMVTKSPVFELPENPQSDPSIGRFIGGEVTFQHPETKKECKMVLYRRKSYYRRRQMAMTKKNIRVLEGDRIVFDLSSWNRDGSQVSISDIEVLCPVMRFRRYGVVDRFNDVPYNKYGFRSGKMLCPEPQCEGIVLFWDSECTEYLQESSDVAFDVAETTNNKSVAIRMKRLDDHTVIRMEKKEE
eukprot:UN25410